MIRAAHQAVHGYALGHTRLTASATLDAKDDELVTRLSDLSGSLTSEADFYPYLTLYPLPSGRFYAVAKTWLDREADRAGCVITHTLLVPTSFWAADDDVVEASVEMLRRPSRSTLSEFSGRVELRARDPERRVGVFAGAGAFVEAYFVLGIEPIVWIGAEEPAVATTAIVRALWPSLRARFSCCTLAFQQRQLDDRPFSLVFSPTGALSRFGDVARDHIIKGHGMAMRPNRDVPDVEELTGLLFADGPEHELYRTLAGSLSSEPTDIRKVLAFRMLRERATGSATAAIGALDILEQLAATPSASAAEKEYLISSVVRSAANTPDALEVLSLLGERLERPAFGGLAATRDVWESVELLVSRDPAGAVEYCARLLEHRPNVATSGFLAAVADALERGQSQHPISFAVLTKYPAAALSMFSLAPHVASAYVSECLGRSELDVGLIVKWLQQLDASERAKARRLLLERIRGKSLAPLYEELLRDVSATDVSWILRELLEADDDYDESSLMVLRERLGSEHREEVADWGARSLWVSSSAATVYAATFGRNREGLRALLALSSLDESRHTLVLTGYLDSLGPPYLPSWASETIAVSETGCTLLLVAGTAQSSAVELLAGILGRSRETSLGTVSRLGERVDALVPSSKRPVIYEVALQEAMDADLVRGAPEQLADCLKFEWARGWFRSARGSAVRDILAGAAARGRTARARCWCFLADAPSDIYANPNAAVEDAIDALVEVSSPWSEPEVTSWVSVIRRLEAIDADRYVTAASQALRFAYAHRHEPFGSLVAAVFFSVHAAAMSREEPRDRRWLRWGFNDWNRAEELRGGLVDSFFGSDWRPEDLVRATKTTWLLRKIARRVLRKWRGEEYLTRALRRLGDEESELRTTLSEILRNPSYEEEWE
jgi:hypothetical protein